jgi:hypothetical protein
VGGVNGDRVRWLLAAQCGDRGHNAWVAYVHMVTEHNNYLARWRFDAGIGPQAVTKRQAIL